MTDSFSCIRASAELLRCDQPPRGAQQTPLASTKAVGPPTRRGGAGSLPERAQSWMLARTCPVKDALQVISAIATAGTRSGAREGERLRRRAGKSTPGAEQTWKLKACSEEGRGAACCLFRQAECWSRGWCDTLPCVFCTHEDLQQLKVSCPATRRNSRVLRQRLVYLCHFLWLNPA